MIVSSRKIDYFNLRKRDHESSDNESDSNVQPKKENGEEGDADSDTDEQNPDLKYIMFHASLQLLIE